MRQVCQKQTRACKNPYHMNLSPLWIFSYITTYMDLAVHIKAVKSNHSLVHHNSVSMWKLIKCCECLVTILRRCPEWRIGLILTWFPWQQRSQEARNYNMYKTNLLNTVWCLYYAVIFLPSMRASYGVSVASLNRSFFYFYFFLNLSFMFCLSHRSPVCNIVVY